MAQETITEQIVRLEAELSVIREAIANQQSLRAIQEGGSGALFRTEFTAADTLYSREQVLVNKLQTLYSYQARVL